MTKVSRRKQQRIRKPISKYARLCRTWDEIMSIMDWSRREYFLSQGRADVLLSHYLPRLKRILFSRGVHGVIAFSKASFLAFLRWIACSPGTLEDRRWKKKCRKIFGRHVTRTDLKAETSRNFIRSVFTALSTSRCFRISGELDPAPIITPSTGYVDELF
jgi:hypothetical protein